MLYLTQGSLPSTRDWCDKQVISHLAFIPSILIAVFYRQPPFVEPLFLITPLCILSTLYHRHHEPDGTLLARIEQVKVKPPSNKPVVPVRITGSGVWKQRFVDDDLRVMMTPSIFILRKQAA